MPPRAVWLVMQASEGEYLGDAGLLKTDQLQEINPIAVRSYVTESPQKSASFAHKLPPRPLHRRREKPLRTRGFPSVILV